MDKCPRYAAAKLENLLLKGLLAKAKTSVVAVAPAVSAIATTAAAAASGTGPPSGDKLSQAVSPPGSN
jgi:ribosomal protein L12E/L44/L45/RPP1/RPP2